MSGRHEVIIDKKAQRQLRKLPLAVTEKLKPAILALADNPRPDGVVKLKGQGKQEPQPHCPLDLPGKPYHNSQYDEAGSFRNGGAWRRGKYRGYGR